MQGVLYILLAHGNHIARCCVIVLPEGTEMYMPTDKQANIWEAGLPRDFKML